MGCRLAEHAVIPVDLAKQPAALPPRASFRNRLAWNGRLLVFACHEAWVHQLRSLNWPIDVVVGLRGRPAGWDQSVRPVPPNARLVRLEDVLRRRETYDCIIAHNLTDLLDARDLAGPRILVLHETLDGAALEQRLAVPREAFRRAAAEFVRLTETHVVAVSALKGRSWGFAEDIVPFSADVEDYLPWRGHLARGLRVAHYIERRPRILLWEFHKRAFEGLPVTLVGRNPGISGVQPAACWGELKQIFSAFRYYIHTADPRLEDGYNMATLEAMAAGLPVLGNRHPTSPVEHGVSGFLSDDPEKLRDYAELLMADRELAGRMGAAGCSASARFSGSLFTERFGRSIERAQDKWLWPQGPAGSDTPRVE